MASLQFLHFILTCLYLYQEYVKWIIKYTHSAVCSVICENNYVTFPVNFERKIHLADTDCTTHTICSTTFLPLSRSKMLFNVDRTTTKWYVKSNSSVYLKVMWTLIFQGKKWIIFLSFLYWKTQYSRLLCNSKWNICLLF